MKSLLWKLVKLNAICFVVLMVFLLLAEAASEGREPGPIAASAVILLIVYAIYANISTVVRARKEIAESIREGAIEAAARAIEFKEAANARVQERLEQRRNEER